MTIIRAGRTVESGSLDSMRHLSRTSIKAEIISDPGDLTRIKGVEDVSIDGNTLRAQVDSESLGELIRALGDAGVRSLVSQPPTLEELFLRHYDTARGGAGVMSTATLDRPRHPAHPRPRAGSNFSGTLGVLRLYLRRDRVSLPLWVLLLSVPLATVYVGSIERSIPPRPRAPHSPPPSWPARRSARCTGRFTTTASGPPAFGKPACSTC